MSIDLQKEAQIFLEKLFGEISDSKINLDHCLLDHVCYRTETFDDYAQCKRLFEKFSTLLIESEINGRPIATYQLNEPIIYKNRVIRVIEVPAPKASSPYPSGFEHAEFVIDEYFVDFAQRFSHLDFKLPKKARLNSEMTLALNRVNLKFHYLPLASVIAIEKYPRLLESIRDLELYSRFSKYQPQISGSIPLGIASSTADLDVLFDVSDFDVFKADLSLLKNQVENLEIKEIDLQGSLVVFASFGYKGMDYEWVGQNKCSLLQRAHQHLLVEARLFNLAGPQAVKAITQLKREGEKTEPAFAKCFGIDGDPYLELLGLQRNTEAELFKKFYQI